MAWRTYGFDVNGLPVAAWYREETVEQVLAPLLARLARSHQEKAGPSRQPGAHTLLRPGRPRVANGYRPPGGRRAAKCRLASIVGKGCRGRYDGIHGPHRAAEIATRTQAMRPKNSSAHVGRNARLELHERFLLLLPHPLCLWAKSDRQGWGTLSASGYR